MTNYAPGGAPKTNAEQLKSKLDSLKTAIVNEKKARFANAPSPLGVEADEEAVPEVNHKIASLGKYEDLPGEVVKDSKDGVIEYDGIKLKREFYIKVEGSDHCPRP